MVAVLPYSGGHNTAPRLRILALYRFSRVARLLHRSARDAQNNSLSFSIASGEDKDFFSITTGGLLSFDTAPDFEARVDADGDNAIK